MRGSAIFILGLLSILACSGQTSERKSSGAFIEVGPQLLWNTTFGDRYVPVQPLTGSIPERDRSFLRERSFAKNTVSPVFGMLFHKQVYRSLWVVLGAEYVRRERNYVFAQDTLNAYPPSQPAPEGLFYTRIVNRVNKLEFPLALEFRRKSWSAMAGLLYFRELSSRGIAETLGGTKVELYNSSGRNVRVFDPWYISLRFSYNGILSNSRLSTSVSAIFPKPYPLQRYWMDLRIGVSYAFGSMGT